jgi:hypothetical protein
MASSLAVKSSRALLTFVKKFAWLQRGNKVTSARLACLEHQRLDN